MVIVNGIKCLNFLSSKLYIAQDEVNQIPDSSTAVEQAVVEKTVMEEAVVDQAVELFPVDFIPPEQYDSTAYVLPLDPKSLSSSSSSESELLHRPDPDYSGSLDETVVVVPLDPETQPQDSTDENESSEDEETNNVPSSPIITLSTLTNVPLSINPAPEVSPVSPVKEPIDQTTDYNIPIQQVFLKYFFTNIIPCSKKIITNVFRKIIPHHIY